MLSVPAYLPQSATIAEMIGLMMAISAMMPRGQYRVVCDCKAVVDGAARREHPPPNPKSLWGGLWKQIYASIKGFSLEVVKVEARRTLEQATADGEVEWYLGNDEADMDAKMITKKFRPSEEDRSLYDSQTRVAKSVLNRAIVNCEAIDMAQTKEPIFVKPKKRHQHKENVHQRGAQFHMGRSTYLSVSQMFQA